jgi:serine/threonine-protein kinase RsbW
VTQSSTTECNNLDGSDEVCLEVPAKLGCRNVVMRTVSAVCKLAAASGQAQGPDVCMELLSAVGEAYNNIVLHGYAGRTPGPIRMKIRNCSRSVRVEISDTGESFDPAQAPPPDLASLPESGIGIFLMRSMVDEVSYVAGCPNVLTLVKRLDQSFDSD